MLDRPFLRQISTLSTRELSFLAGQWYFVLESGSTIIRGMAMLNQRKHHSRLGRLMREIELNILKGESLWAAFDKTGVFPDFFIHMTRVGEESGRLSDIMRRLEDYYEKESQMSEQLKSALMYPFVVGSLMLGVIIIALSSVVPGYARIFEVNGVVLPRATSILIALSSFTVQYGHIMLYGLLAFLVFARYAISTGVGADLKNRLMLRSKLHVLDDNRKFAQALGILLDSGWDLMHSVNIAKNVVGNSILQRRLQSAMQSMAKGICFSLALELEGGFDKMLIAMISLGEETGHLTETVAKSTAHLHKALESLLMRVNKLVEPIITLVLGLVLAFVMLAVMLPAFRIASVL